MYGHTNLNIPKPKQILCYPFKYFTNPESQRASKLSALVQDKRDYSWSNVDGPAYPLGRAKKGTRDSVPKNGLARGGFLAPILDQP